MMTTKSLVRIASVGALGLASIGFASAKSYDIILSSPAMAGTTELKPGAYTLKVEGSQAIFRDAQSSKTWTAPVKIENSVRKFGATVVESTNQGDMDHIHAIDLGGSNTKLEFGE
jgi:hypothetical protein